MVSAFRPGPAGSLSRRLCFRSTGYEFLDRTRCPAANTPGRRVFTGTIYSSFAPRASAMLSDSSRSRLCSQFVDSEDHDGNNNVDAQVTDDSELSLQQESYSAILRDLNPSQIEAVVQPANAITRVVAGPGSGKTRVLTSRIAYLLEQPDQQYTRILGVTFTRKAAGEMQQRLEKLLVEMTPPPDPNDDGDVLIEESFGFTSSPYPRSIDRVTLGTFHSICAKILRWNGELLATLPSVVTDMSWSQNATLLDGGFGIVDQAGQLRTLKECLKEINIELKDFDLKPLPVLTAIAKCRAKLAQGVDPFLPPSKNKPLSKTMQVTAKVYRLYREKLLATNCIDFDDLIYLTRELLLHHEDVRERLQRRWTHILVDEFQDTSKTQMDLVKLLTSTSLFVVGDADQSIYSWRGAHHGSLSDFENEFGGCSTVHLMENYRSTSNIVEAAQKVISQQSGNSTSGADKLRQSMKPKRGAGPSPRVVACKDGRAEANFVIETIKERVDSGEYGPNSSVALIYRTNAQSRALEEACVKQNLPYVIFGSATSFYKRQEVKDCLCFLRWLHNGRDRTAMLRALVTPKRGIGDIAINEFDTYCEYVVDRVQEDPGAVVPTPFDILLSLSGDTAGLVPRDVDPTDYISTRPRKLLTQFSHQMREIVEIAKDEPVERVLSSIIDELNIIPHLDKISKSKAEFEERKANIEELRQASQVFDEDGPALAVPQQSGEDGFDQSPLGAFLDDISLVTDMMEDSEAEGSTENRFVANLMTIHASKGMEFDSVFVVGAEDGTLPLKQAILEGEGSVALEEEKRLCYVAMTRAKTELFLTWRREVPVFTGDAVKTAERDRSRFLDVLLSKKGGKKKKSTPRKMATEAKPRKRVSSPRAQANKRTYSTRRDTSSAFAFRNAPVALPQPTQRFEGTNGILGKQKKRSASRPAAPSPPKPSSRKATRPLRTTPPDPTRCKQVSPETASSAARVSLPRVTARFGKTPESAQATSFPRVTARLGKTPEFPQARKTQTGQRRGASYTSPPPATARRDPPETRNDSTRSPPKKIERRRNQPLVDSTWFFPVGSQVAHEVLGKGTVLKPPDGELVVRVQFENGDKKEFPVHGTDISPIVL